MNREPREPSELAELFEQSAPSLEPGARARLRAAAREIPRRQSAHESPRWAWAAVACGIFAAAVLAVTLRRTAPSATPVAMPESAARWANDAEQPSTSEADDEPNDEANELASGMDFDDASDPDVLDDLALDPGDLADNEVDAWISAANMTLGG